MGEVMNFSIGIVAENGPKLNADWKAPPVDLYEKTQFEIVKPKDGDKSAPATFELSNTAEIEFIAIGVSPSEGTTTFTFNGLKPGIPVEKLPRIFLVQKNVLPMSDKFSAAFETTSPRPVMIQALIGRNRPPPK